MSEAAIVAKVRTKQTAMKGEHRLSWTVLQASTVYPIYAYHPGRLTLANCVSLPSWTVVAD